MKPPKQIKVPEWWRPGNGMMYRRDALPLDHPEQTYHYVKRVYNVDPAVYGIAHPLLEKYKNVSRSELIEKVEQLTKLQEATL